MKVQTARSWLAVALCVLASIVVDVHQCSGAPAASKLVDMRESIVPAWSDVAASGVTKTTPLAITKYWNRLEVEDIERFALKLMPRSKRNKAKQAIEEYYDAANTCLKTSGAGSSMRKAAFESLMSKLRKCIATDGRMPKFAVEDDATATVSDFAGTTTPSGDAGTPRNDGTSAAPSPVSVPASMALSQAPTSTTAPEQPTASPTLSPSAPPYPTPAPTLEPTPAPTLSVAVPPRQDPIRPALSTVPAMSVLDPDGSGSVSMAEWEAYAARLKTAALKLVAGIKEPRSKTLLDKIVMFHYDTLWRCLEKHVAASPALDFASLVAVIDTHCYVKFRYSLFAGMPPFEFIARNAPAVPASAITKWISRSLVVARADMTGARALGFPQSTLTHLDTVVRCVAAVMQAAPTQVIDKTAYHDALALVDQCSAK